MRGNFGRICNSWFLWIGCCLFFLAIQEASAHSKIVLVTGASKGIGLETVKLLAEDSAKYEVHGTYRQGPVPTINNVTMHQVDLSDEAAISEFLTRFDHALSQRHVSILVNNAGMAVYGPLEILEPGDIAYQIRVNLIAPLLLMRHFIPAMRQHLEGCIINVSSVAGMVGPPFMDVYAASKFGLEGVSAALYGYVGKLSDQAKIRCHVIQPGFTKTGFKDGCRMAEPHAEPLATIWRGFESTLMTGLKKGQDPAKVAVEIKMVIEDESGKYPLRVQTNEDVTSKYQERGCDTEGKSLVAPCDPYSYYNCQE
ncbi:SDR family NAD(P)-dependent oxidoreductase [Endozoicomonadaceae bacterium StTr2]